MSACRIAAVSVLHILRELMWLSVFSISVGAACGALLRWGIGTRLGVDGSALSVGTLTANLLGAYLIGISIALFAAIPDISPQWRLFIITGFLGSLTTFSSFSAEIFTLLQGGRWSWALGGALMHVLGSVCLTFCGVATVLLLRTVLRV